MSDLVFVSGSAVAFMPVTQDYFVTRVLFTSAEREVKDSRRSGMYQKCHFLTRLGKQSL